MILFVHALLFLLLRTSVVALDHDQHPSSQEPHWQIGDGKELEPVWVPADLHGPLGKTTFPQQTLMLENIKNYVGVWYREPTNNAYYENCNDVVQILEAGGLAIVVFHTLCPTGHGQVRRQDILLTPQNRYRFVGIWSRMLLSTLPDSFYRDKMMVWEEDNQLHYYVARLPLIMSPLSPDSTDHIQQSIPPSECWGMWIRVPDQNTPRPWADDVACISVHPLIYSLDPQHLPRGYRLDRFVGTWYRMPYALTPVKNRLDLLRIGIRDGMLHYGRDHHPVTMLLSV